MRVLGRAVAMPLVGLVAAGLAVVATPVPAVADTCGPGAGVSVVVDFRELGGGLQTLCDAGGGGKSAAALFADSGYALTYATRQPGFVCRVSGVPADDPCVNTSPVTAYWGLYWSDGSSGSWAYSSRGADSLIVPAGGSVAFAWQGSGQRGVPSVTPPSAAATPTPTPAPTTSAPSPTSPTTSATTKPTKKPTTKPTKTATKTPTATNTPTATKTPTAKPPTSAPTSSGTVTTTPSESASTTDPGTPTGSATESPTESSKGEPSEPSTTESATSEPSESETTEATETPTDDAVPPEARTDEESSRVPTWLTVAILVMLLLAIGMSAYAARRRTRA